MSGATAASAGGEAEARAFVEEHVARLAPLGLEAHTAEWEAATAGGDDAHARSARGWAALKTLYSDAGEARRVRAWLESGAVRDAALRRQLVLLDHEFTANQLSRETIEDLVRRGSELEQHFHTHRSVLGGRAVTNNELLDVLREVTDVGARRVAWEARKMVAADAA